MKVGSFLAYMARLKGREPSEVKGAVREWLDRVGLEDVESKKCEELSKGMQQKVQFIASIIHAPDLLILDEPFSGLDPVNMRLLRDLVIEQHKRGATIIFSTHVMVQAEQICNQIVMINDGEKVLDDTLAGIRAKYDPRSLLFEPLDPEMDVGPLRRLPAITAVERVNGAYEISLAEGQAPAEAMREIVAAMPTARVELNRPSLEDVFVRIVTGEGASDAEEVARLRASVRAGSGSEVQS
jgi:ABC-2 type transport system ATP-binding protein